MKVMSAQYEVRGALRKSLLKFFFSGNVIAAAVTFTWLIHTTSFEIMR
jgi:hypothetical protein